MGSQLLDSTNHLPPRSVASDMAKLSILLRRQQEKVAKQKQSFKKVTRLKTLLTILPASLTKKIPVTPTPTEATFSSATGKNMLILCKTSHQVLIKGGPTSTLHRYRSRCTTKYKIPLLNIGS